MGRGKIPHGLMRQRPDSRPVNNPIFAERLWNVLKPPVPAVQLIPVAKLSFTKEHAFVGPNRDISQLSVPSLFTLLIAIKHRRAAFQTFAQRARLSMHTSDSATAACPPPEVSFEPLEARIE